MAQTFLEHSYTLVTIFLLWYFLRISFHEHSKKKLIGIWILFGVIFNLYSLSWIYTIYPVAWIKPGTLQLLGIFVLHTISSITAGISFAIVGYALLKNKEWILKLDLSNSLSVSFPRWNVQRTESADSPAFEGVTTQIRELIRNQMKPFIFAVSLMLSEIVRSLLLSLLYYGNNTNTGLNWTAGTIGNALSTTPLIEYAYFGGTFGLTFILGYLVYICFSKEHLLHCYKHLFVIIFILLGIHFLLPVNGPQKELTIGVVTTNFQLPEKTDKISLLSFFKKQTEEVHTLTMSLASSSPSLLVYPEDTRYLSTVTKKQAGELVLNFKNTIFVDGGTRETREGGFSNYTVFYKPTWKKPEIRGKSFLMIFNEYMPVFFSKLFTLFLDKSDLENYTDLHNYTPMNDPKVLIINSLRVGTLICSEILSYSTITSVKKDRPDIVFYQAHLNVFHTNPWFLMHMMSFTKVAAAQLRTPLIGSSNGAPSFVISPYGKILYTSDTGFSTALYTVSKKRIEKIK